MLHACITVHFTEAERAGGAGEGEGEGEGEGKKRGRKREFGHAELDGAVGGWHVRRVQTLGSAGSTVETLQRFRKARSVGLGM